MDEAPARIVETFYEHHAGNFNKYLPSVAKCLKGQQYALIIQEGNKILYFEIKEKDELDVVLVYDFSLRQNGKFNSWYHKVYKGCLEKGSMVYDCPIQEGRLEEFIKKLENKNNIPN